MRTPHSSIILYAAIFLLFAGVGAAYFSKGGMLLGNINKVINSSSVVFEVSEEKLETDEAGNVSEEAGPQGSILLARYKIKADKDVVINNIQMNLVDNAVVGENVSYLYIKYPSSKYSSDRTGSSKIKWQSDVAPRFNNLNLEIPANGEDVRLEVYAAVKNPVTGLTLQSIFESFGYVDANSSVVKITDVNFVSEIQAKL